MLKKLFQAAVADGQSDDTGNASADGLTASADNSGQSQQCLQQLQLAVSNLAQTQALAQLQCGMIDLNRSITDVNQSQIQLQTAVTQMQATIDDVARNQVTQFTGISYL